jgi:signal peptide peptidase SppA
MNDSQGIPYSLDQCWAIEPSAFERLRELLATVTPERLTDAVAQAGDAGAGSPGYENRGGVAVIQLSGLMVKKRTLWGRIFGGEAATPEARAAVDAAAADPAIKSLLLVIDSPGGTVAGTADLGDSIHAARGKKPVTAFAEDLAASGAYWAGSQATRFVGNSTAAVGSIGVFAVLRDSSRLAKNIGLEMTVVKSAKGKGTGAPGVPVTEGQLADVQAMVNAHHDSFVAAVARGRGISTDAASKLADGRLHIGGAAVAAGLLDGIDSLDTVLAGMQAAAASDTTTTRAEGPAIEPRAEGEGHLTAQQEDTMAEITQAQFDKALADVSAKFETKVAALGTDVAALAKENADLKAKVTDVSGNVVTMTTKQQTLDLLAKARADVKLTKGNEEILEPAIRAMAEMNIEKAKAFVETLPKLGKGEGKVLHAAGSAGAGTGLPPRHRFDAYGPDVWSRSSDPAMAAYAEKIQWIAAHDGVDGHPKFKNVTEAFQAFHAANADQARVA